MVRTKIIKFTLYVFLLVGYQLTFSQTKNTASIHNDNAIIYIMASNFSRAIDEINIAIRLDSSNADYYYIRGTAYQKMNEIIKALNDFKKTISINKKHTDAIMKCGIIYGKLNDKNKSCYYFNQACVYGENEGCKVVSKFCEFSNELKENSLSYIVNTDKAYFYSQPNFSYKKRAYLVYGDLITALDNQNGFIYINFENSKGTKTSGWILKSDLK